MLSLVLATLLAFSPQGGTVYTNDGGRLRGTVLDAGPAGVTVQLADGSTRKLEPAQVSRVELADGTTMKPNPPPAAAAAAAPVAAAAAQPAPAAAAATHPSPLVVPVDKLDTIYLARGGRVRCLVTEEGPDGVVVRLVDGAERRYAPGQVTRVDWADGTRSDLSASASAAAPRAEAAPAPAAAPAPTYAPAPLIAPTPSPTPAPPAVAPAR